MILKLKDWSGVLLMATGCIHNGIGLFIMREPLGDMIQAGVWNAMDRQFDRAAAFWFMFSGVMVILLGYIVHWAVRRLHVTPPPALGWVLLALSVIGAMVMPVSGFWIVLPQACILIVRKDAPVTG